MNRRAVIESITAIVSGMAAAAAQTKAPAGKGAVVFQHELPNLALENWTVTAVEVTYPPAGASQQHRHPSFAVVYVLEGEVRSQVEGEAERTYSAGQMFYEPPGHIHMVSRNASDTKPAKILALLFGEKGKALTTPA